jgi:hypothetical protein
LRRLLKKLRPFNRAGHVWLKTLSNSDEIEFWRTPTAGHGLWHDACQHPNGRKYFLKMMAITTVTPILILALPLIITIAALIHFFA